MTSPDSPRNRAQYVTSNGVLNAEQLSLQEGGTDPFPNALDRFYDTFGTTSLRQKLVLMHAVGKSLVPNQNNEVYKNDVQNRISAAIGKDSTPEQLAEAQEITTNAYKAHERMWRSLIEATTESPLP